MTEQLREPERRITLKLKSTSTAAARLRLSFCHSKVSVCDNLNPDLQRTEAERRLVGALRAWHFESRAGNAHRLAIVQQEIQDTLEYFICECLTHDPSSRLGGWWSDGVTYLRIESQGGRQYRLRGTTWIGSDGIAPFDIDLTLPNTEEQPFERIRFRIGLLDERGSPVLCDPGWAVDRVLDLSPRYNRDWAMAAELVPPDKSGRTKPCT